MLESSWTMQGCNLYLSHKIFHTRIAIYVYFFIITKNKIDSPLLFAIGNNAVTGGDFD
jgi:hypothetical protein